jgi:hypothetical protein
VICVTPLEIARSGLTELDFTILDMVPLDVTLLQLETVLKVNVRQGIVKIHLLV